VRFAFFLALAALLAAGALVIAAESGGQATLSPRGQSSLSPSARQGGRFRLSPLVVSVYATAGDVLRYLAPPDGVERVAPLLKRLQVSRVFLEGRRGDEYVPPATLAAVRDRLTRLGIATSGGIATVPGKTFGVRQQGKLGWLNWEAEQTRAGVAQFFSENAPVFDQLIVDDFYCTADTSEASQQARGSRSWAQYRQDLLVSLIEPLMVRPAQAARPGARLIIKYPQWYDRFHLFGYDPARMSVPFEQVWVGTEVRNPETQRMGFVQPTQGYVNFRWLASVIGDKVRGAWFDHIECTAQNFLDQAYQSVLAGARELTLFHLGDIVQEHPGDALFAAALPELRDLAAKVRGRAPRGIACYKPPSSEADDNLYLMDYLAMLGLPIVPAARYPADARVAILGAQAAADPGLLDKLRRHLATGATLVLTPALVRRLGAPAEALSGVRVSADPEPGVTAELGAHKLATPVELDLGVSAAASLTRIAAADRRVPWLTSRRAGGGQVLVWNLRTFSEQDYEEVGEVLLPPKKRGLPDLPQHLADELRRVLLAPLGVRLSAPTRVALYLFDNDACLYNFLDRPVRVRLNGKSHDLGPNRLVWLGP